jgi:hypothetical protein
MASNNYFDVSLMIALENSGESFESVICGWRKEVFAW